MSNVIPWSRIWRSLSPIPAPRANSRGRSERPTPKGGLILHWIFSVVLISATSGMYNISEAITFPGNLQAYASGWVGGMKFHGASNHLQKANIPSNSFHQHRLPVSVSPQSVLFLEASEYPRANSAALELRSRVLHNSFEDWKSTCHGSVFCFQRIHNNRPTDSTLYQWQRHKTRSQRLVLYHGHSRRHASRHGLLLHRFRFYN